MSDVFRKSPLGLAEISQRTQRLTPKLRHCLILIDGTRSVADLLALIEQSELINSISVLENEGFIVLSNASSSSSDSVLQFNQMGTLVQSQVGDYELPQHFIDSAGKFRRGLSFEDRRQRGIKAVLSILGVMGESHAKLMTFAHSDEELEIELLSASESISAIGGDRLATRFRDHVRVSARR